jgi:hypothetical protein
MSLNVAKAAIITVACLSKNPDPTTLFRPSWMKTDSGNDCVEAHMKSTKRSRRKEIGLREDAEKRTKINLS